MAVAVHRPPRVGGASPAFIILFGDRFVSFRHLHSWLRSCAATQEKQDGPLFEASPFLASAIEQNKKQTKNIHFIRIFHSPLY
jgi:hypothetical protein